MLFSVFVILKDVKQAQLSNAPYPIEAILSERWKSFNMEHKQNAHCPIDIKFYENVIFAKLVQSSNEWSPIDVTESGIITEVNLVW